MAIQRSSSLFCPGIATKVPSLVAGVAAVLICGSALAVDGSWSATTSGSWSDPLNWEGGTIANGLGFTATFASDITSDVTVTLDANQELTSVIFGDADPATTGTWSIASLQAAAEFERLVLIPTPANSTGTATITVNGNATATMTAPLEVRNNGGVFVKNGTGTLILPNTGNTTDPNRNRIGGKTAITEGTVQIASDFSLGPPPGSYKPDHLTISGGGTLRTNGTMTLGQNRGVTIGAGGGTLSVNGGVLTYAGRFSGQGETLTTTGPAGIILSNSSGSPTEVNWDFSGRASRVFFRNTDALGVGNVTVRDAVRLVSDASAIGVITNPITVESGGGISARRGAATFADVALPSAGSVIFNKDDARTFNLTISSNTALTGDLSVDTSQQAANPVGDVILSGVFTGTGGLVKLGSGESGRLILSGTNSYEGPTSVTTGALLVNGDQSLATGPVTVATGATLGGTGVVGGGTTIETGATLSPGASPGTLSFSQGMTLAAGGNYNWQMLSATGVAGAEDAWDLINVTGGLTIDATSADPFRLNLWTLATTGPDVSGPAANFDPTQAYAWTIASAAGGVTGFAADKFYVETAAVNGTDGFANFFDTGTFAVNLEGNDLQLVFSPGGISTDIVIDVPSGTQTQTEAGYPFIDVATSVTKIGAGTVVFDAYNGYSGPTTVAAGTLEIATSVALTASNVTVDTDATLQIASGVTMQSPSVIVDGGTLSAAAVMVDASTGINSLAINAGTIAGSPAVTVDAGGTLSLVQDARVVLGVGSLAVTETAGGGLVDLGAGQINIAVGGAVAADLRADIIAGRNGGAWRGTTGITSSAAAASGGTRSVGYIVAGDGSARVSFAAAGDVDLTGTVDVFDLVAVNSSGKYGTGTSSVWSQGDFNYDGVTNVFDLVGINTAGTYGRGNYFPAAPTTAGGVAAVPEPASVSILLGGAGLACLFRRRRP
jgi:fibronectin-binding autotransporter adhesin